jgi:histone-lysine N-methyltransferase SETMAR
MIFFYCSWWHSGELLTTREAQQRQKVYDIVEEAGNELKLLHKKKRRRCGSALLVLREFLPSKQACVRLNIDATRVGNVARFINHACDGGNLLPCLVRAAGSLIPKLAFFARRDISEGEELTYSYGSGYAGAIASKKSQSCFCGTSCCTGMLPSDIT